MKQIKIVKGDINHSFSINNKKSLTGKDVDDLFNIIRGYFSKTSSEYAKENKEQCYFYIDDKLVNLKEYKLLEITTDFDLLNECKLIQKSLVYQSLELIFQKYFYDEMNTINILLDDLSIRIEDLFKEKGVYLLIDNLELNFKNIIKLIDPSFLKDDLKANQFDYSAKELVNIKIKLIEYILENDKQTFYIILNNQNLMITNFTSFKNVIIIDRVNNNNEIYDLDNKIDFENEEDLYFKYMDSSTNLEFDKFVTVLKERIKN